MPKGPRKLEVKILPRRKKELSANHGQIDRHWLAGKSYFPCDRIFISSFSETLGMNFEGLNSLLLGIQFFVSIYFDGV